jgi:signal transduction histidine kinase
MFKLLTTVVFIMFISLQGWTQRTLQELTSKPLKTDNVDTLLEISWRFLEDSFDWEGALPYANAALNISKIIPYKLGIAESYIHLGTISQYKKNDFHAAENYFEQAFQIRKEEKKMIKAASACVNLLRLYSDYSKLKAAENIGKTGISLVINDVKNVESADIKAKLHHLLSEVYREKGRYPAALFQLEECLKIREKLDNKAYIIQTYLSLGNFYSENAIKNYSKAKEYYSKGLILTLKERDVIHQAKFLIALGNLHLVQEEPSIAFDYFEQTLSLGQKILFEDKLLATTKLGSAYFVLEKKEEALDIWVSLENTLIEYGDSFELAYLLTDIGMTYDQLSKPQQAFSYLNRANRIANYLDYQPLQVATLKNLTNHHYKKGDFQQAFKLNKVVENIQDSITNLAQNAINYKSDLEETAKEKAEFENIALKLEKQSLMLKGFGIIALLLLITIGFAFYAYRRKKNEELAWKETDNIIREQELKLAYTRLEGRNEERERIARDLHDGLGGMLSSVKLQLGTVEKKIGVLEDDVSKQFNAVTDLLDESFDEVRRISHNMLSSSLEKLGLKFIVEQLADQIRYSKQIEVNVDTHNMNERLDKFLEVQLYRVFQELMRNILKHARAERIDIQLNRFEDTINLMIEDNGIGFNVEAVKARHKGIGLANIEKRIQELDGTLTIDAVTGRGTTVMIDIPVKDKYQ